MSTKTHQLLVLCVNFLVVCLISPTQNMTEHKIHFMGSQKYYLKQGKLYKLVFNTHATANATGATQSHQGRDHTRNITDEAMPQWSVIGAGSCRSKRQKSRSTKIPQRRKQASQFSLEGGWRLAPMSAAAWVAVCACMLSLPFPAGLASLRCCSYSSNYR